MQRLCRPLLVWKVGAIGKPLGTGCDTHTVPLRGARVGGLNRHLKSLRNERKERQKEQR